jgi:hypothetical protein
MLVSQQSWVRSQHPPTKWNLRGGRWSSVEYSTYVENNYEKIPLLEMLRDPTRRPRNSRILNWEAHLVRKKMKNVKRAEKVTLDKEWTLGEWKYEVNVHIAIKNML